MYTALFWIQTLLHVLLVAWLVRIYRQSGLLVAAVLIIPQAGLVWDNGVVAAGSLIGSATRCKPCPGRGSGFTGFSAPG